MPNNLLSSSPYTWSGLSDASIRPTLIAIQTSSGTFRPATTDDFGVSLEMSGITLKMGAEVGVTGNSGLGLDVLSYLGYNAVPVVIVSGGAGGGGTSFPQVGITGSSGLAVNVVNAGGLNSFAVAITSGMSSSTSFPQVGITGSNGLAASILSTNGVNALAVFNPSGDSVKPSIPPTQGTYAIPLTGIGVFGNYSSTITNVNGTVSISIETDSLNTDRVYYAFSGTATTGQAWELRGDKGFELSSTTGIFFAQATSGQRVMVHFQSY